MTDVRTLRLADQRDMEARLEIAVPRELAGQAVVAQPRHDLDTALRLVVAIPGDQLFDVALMPLAQSDHAVERLHRKVARHQRRRVLVDATIGDADRVAGDALEHLEARQRVGELCLKRPVNPLERWDHVANGE